MELGSYDGWKTTPPEPKPLRKCNMCGEDLYEGDVLYTIDGGICEDCLEDHYKSFVQEG